MRNHTKKKIIAAALLLTVIITAFSGCNYIRAYQTYRQNKIWPKESAQYLADRYPNDTFTFVDTYETLPLDTTVFRYSSANYPDCMIEVGFSPDELSATEVNVEDNYQWIKYGDDLVKETEKIMKDIFPDENYGICMQMYWRAEGPVYSTLDEFLDAAIPTVYVVLYTDPTKDYPEDYETLINTALKNCGHDFDITLFFESDEPNPAALERGNLLKYIDENHYDSKIFCNMHKLKP